MDFILKLSEQWMTILPCSIDDLSKNRHLMAYGSTLLISIAPYLILFFFRLNNTEKHQNFLRLALSFASGGLLGDAFLHLIPHAMIDHDHGHDHHHHENHHEHENHLHEDHDHHHNHNHDHEHDHQHNHDHSEQALVGLNIVAGLFIFFIIEKFVHMVSNDSHSHHHHNHQTSKGKTSDSDADSAANENKKNKSKQTNQNLLSENKSAPKKNRITGYLNLFADFLHNFTDGLTIGATFATSSVMISWTTTALIFFHEIPHEIGDYSILIKAGFTRIQAMSLQLVTAIGALFGTAVGLHFGTWEKANKIILPFTAGGFIYIATVNIMGELLQSPKSDKTGSNNFMFLQFILELFTFLFGIFMMYVIALNE